MSINYECIVDVLLSKASMTSPTEEMIAELLENLDSSKLYMALDTIGMVCGYYSKNQNVT